jgi:hypothetical protein
MSRTFFARTWIPALRALAEAAEALEAALEREDAAEVLDALAERREIALAHAQALMRPLRDAPPCTEAEARLADQWVRRAADATRRGIARLEGQKDTLAAAISRLDGPPRQRVRTPAAPHLDLRG